MASEVYSHVSDCELGIVDSTLSVERNGITTTMKDVSGVQTSDAQSKVDHELSIGQNRRSERYVFFLEKQLEDLQRKFKKLDKSLDTEATNEETIDPGSKEPQKIEITRVSAEKWRKIKNVAKVDTKHSILIVSSKQDIKTRRGRDRKPTENNGSAVGIPYRLAVNSTYLLQVLSQCTGTTFPEENNVLVRPFKYLVAYEADIREWLMEDETICEQAEVNLARAREAIGDVPVGTDTNESLEIAEAIKDVESLNKNSSDKDLIQKLEAEYEEAKRNRDQVRCLIEFMDQDMRDIFEVNKAALSHSVTEIAFEHLWLVYKPGSIIYMSKPRESRNLCRAYRVIHVTGGRVCFDDGKKVRFSVTMNRLWEPESENDEKCRDTVEASVRGMTAFVIDCYYLDFDGYRIAATAKRFAIAPYNGKRSILSFPVYPSLFDPRHQELDQLLLRRGRRFMELAYGAHKKYSGVTLREQNRMSGKSRSTANWIIADAEIKGEVVVDQASGAEYFKKKLQSNLWNIKFGGVILVQPTTADKRETFDALSKVSNYWITDVFDDSEFEEDRRSKIVHSTDELCSSLDPSRLTDNVVRLLPPRVYGYAMLHHKWFPLDINLVEDFDEEELKTTRSSFENLVLPDGHRTLLQALIENQVRAPKQDVSKPEAEGEEFSMDLVKGKGKGLIILLHGVPGVGKSSTAESVAAHLKRPLLPITCGDIGNTAKEAEQTLEYFCELAHKWRCVLLLDEADVFLAKRDKNELARNSLVSVFLRVLEYYSGVIILTTNRVGEFDEAFRSRIHISLYYPELTQKPTVQIWERNISHLRKSDLDIDIEEDEIRSFYKAHWRDTEENPSHRWNGRQIKNAFQTALALAKWDFHDSPEVTKLERPCLRGSHLKRVAETSAHFDNYLAEVHGLQGQNTYSVLAAREELRMDTHPGLQSRARFGESRERRSTAARHGGNRDRYGLDDFDNESRDDDIVYRKERRRPSSRPRRGAKSHYYDDESLLQPDDGRLGTTRRPRSDVDEASSSRDPRRPRRNFEEFDVDEDEEEQELERELARVKKRKADLRRNAE